MRKKLQQSLKNQLWQHADNGGMTFTNNVLLLPPTAGPVVQRLTKYTLLNRGREFEFRVVPITIYPTIVSQFDLHTVKATHFVFTTPMDKIQIIQNLTTMYMKILYRSRSMLHVTKRSLLYQSLIVRQTGNDKKTISGSLELYY